MRYLSTVFRGAQLIDLINDHACQRPQAIIRDSCGFFNTPQSLLYVPRQLVLEENFAPDVFLATFQKLLHKQF